MFPPMATIANAIRAASGLRMPDLPITYRKLRAAIDAADVPPLFAAAEKIWSGCGNVVVAHTFRSANSVEILVSRVTDLL